MKVLFAVNNDKISEAVIKRYPKEYKELLSYKNVYYFNAILKEIQNDKSYDRIVISEDLEPFVNTNNDSIDNFIFNHLDKISDEAQGIDGKEISIILICSERRTFGSSILNKLFSIGIYNALIGNDRSMDNLCKLINRPRNKKEAKAYYRIDQANYESVSDNGGVREPEIQNILNHFKKLGKNTDRYTDSFNNIAAQYTDEQLKIIINVLPIKVKAVLEAESEKYQSLMGTSGEARRQDVAPLEPGIRVNTIGNSGGNNINGPIVIPSGVKKFTGGTRPVIPSNTGSRIQATPVKQQVQPTQQVRPQAQPIQKRVEQQATNNIVQKANTVVQKPIVNESIPTKQVPQQQTPIIEEPVVSKVETVEEPVVSNQQHTEQKPSNGQRYTGTIAQVKRTLIARRKSSQAQSLETPNVPTVDDQVEDVKRGRGRPKKVVSEEEVKPKGKRGRPRKNVPEEDNNIDDLLGGIGNSVEAEDVVMPGLDDDIDDVLPGLDSTEEDNGMLPGLGSVEEDDTGVLPGIEEDDSGEEVDVNSLLAGLDDEDEESLPGVEEDSNSLGFEDNEEDDGMLPGLDNNDDDFGTLPGLDDNEEDDGILPGLGSTVEEDDGVLPGLDDSDDFGVLPGLDSNTEETNNVISGIDSLDEETVLPGMGFENDVEEPFNNNNNIPETNAIESIKPQINYSMSNLNSLLSKDKKIVSFVGATKNGTSFLINNLALMLSMIGIDTAILDMTTNKNSYYLFTDSREELRKIAYTSFSKLENGYADGIKFNKNLTVYTGLPSDTTVYENAEPILSTLVQNHSLVLIDTDFNTPPAYFASSQEIYLVQSMDIMTIQPLTAFLRELKFKGAWEPEKARVVINKEVPIKRINNKDIISGMSRYKGPDMSVMTDLFNKDMVKACSIPFDEKVYSKYLETLATCKLSISSFPKQFIAKLQILREMVYPRLNGKTSYSASPDMESAYSSQGNTFSKDTNNILNKMKNKF